MTSDPRVAALLTRATGLLIDFDGPICSVFAGRPASGVAGRLRRLLEDQGVTLPDSMVSEPDPLAVLRWVGVHVDGRLTERVDDALRTEELDAVRSAESTPDAAEFIIRARRAERRLAVVSNNSESAIRAYLTDHGLDHAISVVVGRRADPARMKPHPDPILQAVRDLDVEPDRCVLIGDSVTDIIGGRAAGVRVIAFAYRPEKVARLSARRPDALITRMRELTDGLGPRP